MFFKNIYGEPNNMPKTLGSVLIIPHVIVNSKRIGSTNCD